MSLPCQSPGLSFTFRLFKRILEKANKGKELHGAMPTNFLQNK